MSVTCPKCGGVVEQAGVAEIDGLSLDVYQCDRCIVEVPFDGESVQCALTFVLGENGPFYPNTPDGSFP